MSLLRCDAEDGSDPVKAKIGKANPGRLQDMVLAWALEIELNNTV